MKDILVATIKFALVCLCIALLSACSGMNQATTSDDTDALGPDINIGDVLPPKADETVLEDIDTDVDADDDGVADALDADPFDSTICGDSDGDTCDDCTNGPSDPSNDGLDSNADGICDAGEADTDGDDVIDMLDNCPDDSNADQDDGDGDGVGDVCDNCPADANANQRDKDSDGFGNVCDDDIDGDGVLNDDDNCDYIINPDQEDEDGDGTGDACEFPYVAVDVIEGIRPGIDPEIRFRDWLRHLRPEDYLEMELIPEVDAPRGPGGPNPCWSCPASPAEAGFRGADVPHL